MYKKNNNEKRPKSFFLIPFLAVSIFCMFLLVCLYNRANEEIKNEYMINELYQNNSDFYRANFKLNIQNLIIRQEMMEFQNKILEDSKAVKKSF